MRWRRGGNAQQGWISMDQTPSYPDRNQERRRRVALPAFLITLALAMALLWSGGFATFPSALAQTDTSTPETSASSSSIAQVADQASKAVVTITNLRELDEDFSLEPQFPQEDPSGG